MDEPVSNFALNLDLRPCTEVDVFRISQRMFLDKIPGPMLEAIKADAMMKASFMAGRVASATEFTWERVTKDSGQGPLGASKSKTKPMVKAGGGGGGGAASSPMKGPGLGEMISKSPAKIGGEDCRGSARVGEGRVASARGGEDRRGSASIVGGGGHGGVGGVGGGGGVGGDGEVGGIEGVGGVGGVGGFGGDAAVPGGARALGGASSGAPASARIRSGAHTTMMRSSYTVAGILTGVPAPPPLSPSLSPAPSTLRPAPPGRVLSSGRPAAPSVHEASPGFTLLGRTPPNPQLSTVRPSESLSPRHPPRLPAFDS